MTTNATPGPVDVTQAEKLFDAILGNVAAYGEWGTPSYREAALRDISAAFARHRIEAARPVQSELVEALGIADGIIEADLMDAIEHGDADWEGRTRTALEAIRALVATATGDGL